MFLLEAVVHLGDHDESDNCIATITVSQGEATIGEPAIETIPDISQQQMRGSMMDQLTQQRR